MKALSIREPWISLIASGKKTIETRTWSTKYRGPLLLVGSKKPNGIYSGLAACIVYLKDCRPMTKEDEAEACCEIYENAYSWILGDLQRVVHIKIQGRLGLYEVPDQRILIIDGNKPICKECRSSSVDGPHYDMLYGTFYRCKHCRSMIPIE